MAVTIQPERLYFEEIDGQRRRVTLAGNEAPHGHFREAAAFTDGGEVRRTLKYEPGVNPPAVHITGTKEEPLVIKGHLRDSLTGNSGFGTDLVAPLFEGRAQKLKEQIDAIRTAARPLRIVWRGGAAGGLLLKALFPYEAAGEYQYELTFDVYWRGAPPKRRVRRPLSPSSGAGGIEPLVSGAPAALVNAPGVSLPIAEALSTLLNAALVPLSQLLTLAAGIESGVGDVLDFASRCEALWNRLKEFIGFVHAMLEPDDASDAAAWRFAHAAALNALYDAAEKTYQLGVDAETKASGVTAGVYMSKDGDTLDQIAIRLGLSLAKLREANPTLPLGRLSAWTKVRIPGA